MINPQELRLGNWVLINGEPEQIDSVHQTYGANLCIFLGGWGDAGDVSSYEFKEIDPIPLSPEILEKANEILKTHPTLVKKRMVTVRKRLNREVDVMLYTLHETEKAMDLYFELNKKGGSKCLKN